MLISHYKTKDAHQADALASAIFAFKQIKDLLKKIELFVKVSPGNFKLVRPLKYGLDL